MMYKPIIKWQLYLVIDFEFTFRFGVNDHGVIIDLNTLRFYLAALNQQVVVLFFMSNMLVKRHSDFIALFFFAGFGIMGDLGLLLVNP